MKATDLSGPIFISMGAHGVSGAAVQTTDSDIRGMMRDVKKLMRRDNVSTDELKEVHAALARELSAMLPKMAKDGFAIDSHGEYYDSHTFDNDLVLCAVYDHIANGKSITLTTNLSPGKGDRLHQ